MEIVHISKTDASRLVCLRQGILSIFTKTASLICLQLICYSIQNYYYRPFKCSHKLMIEMALQIIQLIKYSTLLWRDSKLIAKIYNKKNKRIPIWTFINVKIACVRFLHAKDSISNNVPYKRNGENCLPRREKLFRIKCQISVNIILKYSPIWINRSHQKRFIFQIFVREKKKRRERHCSHESPRIGDGTRLDLRISIGLFK